MKIGGEAPQCGCCSCVCTLHAMTSLRFCGDEHRRARNEGQHVQMSKSKHPGCERSKFVLGSGTRLLRKISKSLHWSLPQFPLCFWGDFCSRVCLVSLCSACHSEFLFRLGATRHCQTTNTKREECDNTASEKKSCSQTGT